MSHLYSSAVKASYASLPIRSSTSPAPCSPTWILAIHPSASGPLFIVPGFSCKKSFAAMIFPVTGVLMSDADLTDSTAPIVSPRLTSRLMEGSSAYTTSPSCLAAYVDMPIVPGETEDQMGSGQCGTQWCGYTSLAIFRKLDPLVRFGVFLLFHCIIAELLFYRLNCGHTGSYGNQKSRET